MRTSPPHQNAKPKVPDDARDKSPTQVAIMSLPAATKIKPEMVFDLQDEEGFESEPPKSPKVQDTLDRIDRGIEQILTALVANRTSREQEIYEQDRGSFSSSDQFKNDEQRYAAAIETNSEEEFGEEPAVEDETLRFPS